MAIKLKQPRCTAHTFARYAGTNDKSVFHSIIIVMILFRIKKKPQKIEELSLELDFTAPEKLIFLTLGVALLQFLLNEHNIRSVLNSVWTGGPRAKLSVCCSTAAVNQALENGGITLE